MQRYNPLQSIRSTQEKRKVNISLQSDFMSNMGTIECCHPKNEIEGSCQFIETSARSGRKKERI